MKNVCLIMFVVMILSGCWDLKEVEQQLYIHALAVDYKDGKYVLYGQIIDFSSLAKQEGVANRQPQKISTVKGTGETINDAAFDFYTAAQQRISWEHITTIVYSENILKKRKIHDVNDFLTRYFQIRNIIWAFGTKASIEDVFQSSPILNITILYSQLSNPDDIYKQNSVIKPIKLFELERKLTEPAVTIGIPYLTISKDRWKENKKGHPVLFIGGLGFVKDKNYVGFVSRDDLLGKRWITKEVKRTGLDVQVDKKMIAAGPAIHIKSKITPVKQRGRIKFNIDVKTDFKTTEMMKKVSEKTIRNLAEQYIKDQINKTYQIGLKKKIDIFEFSSILYRERIEDWKQIETNGTIPLGPDSINQIHVTCRVLNTEKLKD
jgi:spore germination protein KC